MEASVLMEKVSMLVTPDLKDSCGSIRPYGEGINACYLDLKDSCGSIRPYGEGINVLTDIL